MLTFNPRIIPHTVVVIGAGGTGSRLVPALAQFMKTVPWLNELLEPHIIIFDDDVVENKNLARQNFIAPDVGRPKAEVLAQRYSRAFDVKITPVVSRFGTLYNEDFPCPRIDDSTLNYMYSHKPPVVISCVDTVEARKSILVATAHVSQDYDKPPVIIDAGNENDFGQVSVYNPTLGRFYDRDADDVIKSMWQNIPDMDTENIGINHLPCFPLLRYEGQTETELSCADLDQTLAVNSMMATGILAVFQNLTFQKPIVNKSVYYRLDGSNFSERILPQDLLDAHDACLRLDDSGEEIIYGLSSDQKLVGHHIYASSMGYGFGQNRQSNFKKEAVQLSYRLMKHPFLSEDQKKQHEENLVLLLLGNNPTNHSLELKEKITRIFVSLLRTSELPVDGKLPSSVIGISTYELLMYLVLLKPENAGRMLQSLGRFDLTVELNSESFFISAECSETVNGMGCLTAALVAARHSEEAQVVLNNFVSEYDFDSVSEEDQHSWLLALSHETLVDFVREESSITVEGTFNLLGIETAQDVHDFVDRVGSNLSHSNRDNFKRGLLDRFVSV